MAIKMSNFFKKEYEERLKECRCKNSPLRFYNEKNEVQDEVDITPIIDKVFQAGWEAYRAAVLEASYL